MEWTIVDKAEHIPELSFRDGIIYENPAWVNKERTGFVYHCSEGGFGVVVYPEEDEEDGSWGKTLDQALANAKHLIRSIEEEKE